MGQRGRILTTLFLAVGHRARFARRILFLARGSSMAWMVSAIMLVAGVLTSPTSPAAAANPYGEVTIAFELRRAPDSNVYYVVGQSGVPGANNEGFTSNAGFVVTNKGVVVYDALGTPALGYELLRAVRGVTDTPVTLVIAGHYHADHIYGLQAFEEHTDAEIWAQEKADVYIASPAAEKRLQQRRDALYPWVDDDAYIVEPDHTFQQRKVFHMGDVHVELIYVGPAHSPSDVMMVVPEEGIIFSGDIVFKGRLPFLAGSDVDTANWLKGLERLQSMETKPRFIIPGHGQPAADPSQAIRFTKNYIEYLRTTMGEAAAELIAFDTAYGDTDWSDYKDVPTFDEANRRNAYSVYLEMQAALF